MSKIFTTLFAATLILSGMLFLMSKDGYAACTAPAGAAGEMIYNASHKVIQFCNDTKWVGVGGGGSGTAVGENSGGGMTADMIVAFPASTCPAGWDEYMPARGRFLRGIDPTGATDPSGVRAPENLQGDAIAAHNHKIRMASGLGSLSNGASYFAGTGSTLQQYQTDQYTGTIGWSTYGSGAEIIGTTTSTETRPKNVAVIYCKYSGSGGSSSGGSSGGGSVASTLMVKAYQTHALTLTGSTTIPYNNEVIDTDNAFNPATGVFTAPSAGVYLIDAAWYSSAIPSGICAYIHIVKNGAYDKANLICNPGSTNLAYTNSIAGTVSLAQNDTISIMGAPSTGSIPLTSLSVPWHYLSIAKISGGSSSSGGSSLWTQNGSNIHYSTGNVGIGISSPTEKLSVEGNSRFGGTVFLGSAASPHGLISYTNNTGNGEKGVVFQGNTGNGVLIRPNNGVTDGISVINNGNVGIGTNAPTSKLQVNGSIIANGGLGFGSGKAALGYYNTGPYDQIELGVGGGNTSTNLSFHTNGITRMWITPNGLFGIGTMTPAAKVDILNQENMHKLAIRGYGSGYGNGLVFYPTNDSAHAVLFHNSGGSLVGSISPNASSTAYNTTSDYRLKDEIRPMEGALSSVLHLKPSSYVFKTDPTHRVDGFIAHEIQEIAPYAVTGEKDAVDKDGKPVYQQVDYGKLTPLLAAAIQELEAKHEKLRADMEAENAALRTEIEWLKKNSAEKR